MQRFRIDFGRRHISDLHRRIDETIWPPMPFATEWTAGTDDHFLRDLVQYWRHRYDWFAVQDELNARMQLRGPIQGEQLHCVFYQATGQRQPFPLLMLHGWPGSFMEFHDAAPLLAAAGFDVVVASLPGYTLSEPPRTPGMTPARMAERMHLLMRELGYTRYGVQGGDWGAFVSTELALAHPQAVVALHLNWAPTLAYPGPPQPPDERRRGDAYGDLHRTTPQSLAYALQDSPVGALAWILWRYRRLTERGAANWSARYRDRVLTTVMLYWLPRSILSAARLYWESPINATGRYTSAGKVGVPTGYARFGGSPARELVEPHYNLVHYSEPPRGGHFAALEEPELFAADVRAFFSKQFAGIGN